jgi:predicted RNA binding protein YcfA (HicA-like mRNA interferase family)
MVWINQLRCVYAGQPGRVTVAGKPSDDLAPGTLNSILKQSGLKK